MSHNDIRDDVVRRTLPLLPAEFRTKDLSLHPEMQAGHLSLASDTQFNAWVGKYLSERCGYVSNVSRAQHRLGAKWKNHLHGKAVSSEPSTPKGRASTPSDPSEAPPEGIGPQSASDNAFTARMRLHQSWYRNTVLGVPCGTGPRPTDTSHYGNMLRRDDAIRGLNFLHPAIHDIARERLREGTRNVEPFRLLHNMLSSQPMCFNLFGLFVKRPALATQLLRIFPELELDEVIEVKLEYAPQPNFEYLGDCTSFDAFVDYRRTDGTRALLGIETKLTEPFSQKQYDSPAYRRWMNGPHSPWTDEGALHVSQIRHNQLWRDHLLAIAMRDRAGSPYRHAALMLVRHPLDYDCARTVEGYRTLLRPEDRSFIDMPLDVLVERWRDAVGADDEAWIEGLHTRYVDLGASGGALR